MQEKTAFCHILGSFGATKKHNRRLLKKNVLYIFGNATFLTATM